MSVNIISPEDLESLRLVLCYLKDEQLFKRLSYKMDQNGFEHHFHLSSDIKVITGAFKQMAEDLRGTGQKRILAIRSNIGDGKTSLLWYLKYRWAEKVWCINPIVNSDKKWQIAKGLLWQLLYVMYENRVLAEKDYNKASVELKNALQPFEIQAKVSEWLAKIKSVLKGHYLIWFCDNVSHHSYIDSVRAFLDLQDPEPPQLPFFDDVPNLIVLSTSEREVANDWEQDANMEAAGHKLLPLRVCKEDALGIVDKILAGISQTGPADVKPAFLRWRERPDTKLYPFEGAGLEAFLGKKARRVTVTDARVGVETELAEIQLRNTLLTLQRAVDEAPLNNGIRPVGLEDLNRADSVPSSV